MEKSQTNATNVEKCKSVQQRLSFREAAGLHTPHPPLFLPELRKSRKRRHMWLVSFHLLFEAPWSLRLDKTFLVDHFKTRKLIFTFCSARRCFCMQLTFKSTLWWLASLLLQLKHQLTSKRLQNVKIFKDAHSNIGVPKDTMCYYILNSTFSDFHSAHATGKIELQQTHIWLFWSPWMSCSTVLSHSKRNHRQRMRAGGVWRANTGERMHNNLANGIRNYCFCQNYSSINPSTIPLLRKS